MTVRVEREEESGVDRAVLALAADDVHGTARADAYGVGTLLGQRQLRDLAPLPERRRPFGRED
jgi:hypothetical protein